MDKYEQRRLNLVELMRLHCHNKPAELAKRLSSSDSYASRMLYEEGRSGKKRIGEDMVERINDAFGLRPGELDAPLGKEEFDAANERLEDKIKTAASELSSIPQYAWLSIEEMELVTLYRTTDDRDRTEIMRRAKSSRRVIARPSIVRN